MVDPEIERKVMKINKKLSKILQNLDKHNKAIKHVKKLMSWNLDLLTLNNTKIGRIVNQLRKTTKNEELGKLTRILVKDWRNLLPKYRNSLALNKENTLPNQSGNNPENLQSLEFHWTGMNDETRLKARNLLANAMCAHKGNEANMKDNPEIMHKASELEEAIYMRYKKINDQYRACVRSRAFNLRDANNPKLILNYLNGVITPGKLAMMTSNEMASDELKQLREQYRHESIIGSQLCTYEGTKTALLKCNKCKSRHCTYSQFQTRSGDESITTFVVCSSCGNRWKFN